MAHEHRIEPTPEDADWMTAEPSQDALARGAARRRGRRSGGSAAAAPAMGSPARAYTALATVQSSPPPRAPVRDAQDDSFWRAQLESELKSVRAALATLEASVAQDRASHGADGLAARQAAEERLDALGSMETRLARLEEHVSVLEVPDRPPPEVHGESALTDETGQVGALEHKLEALAAEQSSLAETLAAVSQSLVAQRLKTTTLSMAGIAFTLVAAAIWLLAKGPGIF